MFEVGKDIFKRGVVGASGNASEKKRLRFIYKVFFYAFLIFICRTLWLGIQGTDTTRKGTGKGEWIVSRADIIDRNGDILAKNIMTGHIMLFPQKIEAKDKERVAEIIHQALPLDYSLSKALQVVNSSRRFMYLKKFATEKQREIIKNAKIVGLEIEPVQMRRYPKRRLFSHIVGFVSKDGKGLEGVERIYDKYLTENKDPLQLSLDARIQAVFYEQLSLAMQNYEAKAAMGMLMNSRTGEMIAMVSLPDFDPENVGLDPVENRMFKPLRGVFEMGSSFKTFNTAMAMENGINKEYYIAEPFAIKDKFGRTAARISDVRSFKPPRPNLTVEEIMLHSCNAGSAQIALDLPDDYQKNFFHRLHMDEPLELEFGKTERPLMPLKWGPVEKATVSFGHGISVTPMHLLLGINSMINGGVYIYPTIKKKALGAVSGERVLSEDISKRIREIMIRVTEETSAKQARIAGIKIGGKTATAEKYINGRIDRRKNLTSFIGIFPADAPQYIILVMLDEPKATPASSYVRTAAYNSVPTAGKILDSILPLLFE